MRPIIFSVSFALALGLQAGEQLIQVTPGSLSGWNATGVDLTRVAQAPQLTLPAGTQLARAFSGAGLAVKLITQPVFSLEPADWPVLEIGSAALVFLRTGDDGKLALVLDDKPPYALPLVIELAANGRSASPLNVTLTRIGSVVTVSALGETLQFEATLTANPLQEVVVSAGASQAWPLEAMSVVVSTPDAAPIVGNAPSGVSASIGGSTASNAQPRSADTNPGQNRPGVASSHPAGKPAPTSAQASGAAFEVFTPPAVRHGRADVVRAAVAGGRKP